MNHKRGRPKNRRAGCLFCKPHKANGAKNRVLPRDARRTEPTRSTDSEQTDDEYAFTICDCLECRISDLFDRMDAPPPVTFTFGEASRFMRLGASVAIGLLR